MPKPKTPEEIQAMDDRIKRLRKSVCHYPSVREFASIHRQPPAKILNMLNGMLTINEDWLQVIERYEEMK